MTQDNSIPKEKKNRWNNRKTFMVLAGVIFFLSVCTFLIWVTTEYTQLGQKYGIATFKYNNSKKGIIYSADGTVLTYLYRLNKEYVPLDEISEPMQRAIIAIEDHRFYRHFGVDIRGTLRALYKDIIHGETIEGGSTITQQLVRNLFLTPEKTISRKISEILLAVNLERCFTKEEILEMYLNEIYFGNGCYGVESASMKYFGKHADQLSLSEATILAGIPKAPNYYEPINHFRENRIRQKLTINRMVELNYISENEAKSLISEKLAIKNNIDHNKIPYKFPYFTSEVIKQLIKMYGKDKVFNGGLRVITTLDTKATTIAEEIARKKVEQFKAWGVRASNLSIVSVRNTDGAVISLIGGSDFILDQNNLATIPRQPGSAIKPIHYAGALEMGVINENSVLDASSKNFGRYQVSSNINSNVSVCTAIKHSMNVPAVEVVNRLGVPNAVENLKQFGITTVSDQDSNLAIALGGMYQGIKPLELAAAYATFPNSGRYNRPYMIRSVTDGSGKLLYKHQTEAHQIISLKTAQLITQMLLEVVRGGTGTNANISGNEAGKTGTTDDSRCLWFIGFNKELTTAVWVGNSNNSPVSGYHGGDLAAPIWREYTLSMIKSNIINYPSKIYEHVIPLKQIYIAHVKPENEQQQMHTEEGTEPKDANTNKPAPNENLTPAPMVNEAPYLPKDQDPSPINLEETP